MRVGLVLVSVSVLSLAVGCSGTPAEKGKKNNSNAGGSSSGGSVGDVGGSAGTGGSAPGGSGGTGGDAGGSGGSGGSVVAPSGAWVNATGNLANMPSECGNLPTIAAKPNSGMVIAGVAQHGLWATEDGVTWTELGTGAGSAVITNRPSSFVFDPDDANTWWESGIYNGGGVYKTTDNGETFTQLGDVTHNDLVSVDLSDAARQTLLVGTHEQVQKLFLSTNGGTSFTDIGLNLPADSNHSTAPHIIDAQTFLLGSCGYADGMCGIFRSTNGGTDWSVASDVPAVGQPLVHSDGTIYWSAIYDNGIAKSTDQGVTWTKTVNYGVVATAPLIELPDGRMLTVNADHVVISTDAATWTPIGETIPFKPSGVVYATATKTMYVWHWDCGNAVLPDAIATAGFDWETQ
jgi:hypothetical protein